MKLAIYAYTVFLIIVTGNCGLVKDFLGTIHQEVHTVIDKTVNTIGTVTHKIQEPIGVFLHRKEGDSKNVQQTGLKVPSSTSIPKIDPYVEQTGENNEKNNANLPNNVKTDIKYTSNNNINGHPTASTVEQVSVESVNNLNTDTSKDNGKNKIELNKVSHENKDTPTTPENILATNDIKLDNVLSASLLDDIDLYAINAVRGSFPNNDTNTEALPNSTSTNGSPSNFKTGREQNLVSDQMIFPDSRDDLKKRVKRCSKGLVRSMDGNCLEPIDFDFTHNGQVGSVFEDQCPPGYGRALDGSCQRDLGWFL